VAYSRDGDLIQPVLMRNNLPRVSATVGDLPAPGGACRRLAQTARRSLCRR
jgi:hypothetical protein